MWKQHEIELKARARGFHLVTREVVAAVPELGDVEVGLLHLLIQHTSASLTLNENASPDVRRDFESWFSEAVPEGSPLWTHTLEGPDDMPAHVKASLLGPSLTLPVRGADWCSAPGRGSTCASTATAAGRGESWRRCGGSEARALPGGSIANRIREVEANRQGCGGGDRRGGTMANRARGAGVTRQSARSAVQPPYVRTYVRALGRAED